MLERTGEECQGRSRLRGGQRIASYLGTGEVRVLFQSHYAGSLLAKQREHWGPRGGNIST
jgi:hypothetical protein